MRSTTRSISGSTLRRRWHSSSPELAASVARDYADFLVPGDPGRRHHGQEKNLFPINLDRACPHDLGGPGEDPFVTPNSYTYRDGTL